jgi:putative N6-adenine-specific DNA methylase
MTNAPLPNFEIFLVTLPGLEDMLLAEVREQGFKKPKIISGGVLIQGGWPEVWRANLVLRGASKVLARIGEFRAQNLKELEKNAADFPWAEYLRVGCAIKVDVTTNKRNGIYHSGAAEERLERAIAEAVNGVISSDRAKAEVLIKARIVKNIVQLSVDTSGVALHKRGYKQALGKAPLRETIAAMTLRACGYKRIEPLLDPMCGSGTYLIEASEMAANLMAGRGREFAFEKLVSYDADAVNKFKTDWFTRTPPIHFYGFDQNGTVINAAKENTARAGVSEACHFKAQPLSKLTRPEGPPGLVIVNPPYGTRIGNKKALYALHRQFGDIMRAEFTGWRVGLVTSDDGLAQATNLNWSHTSAPIPHGGLKIRLYRTDILE